MNSISAYSYFSVIKNLGYIHIFMHYDIKNTHFSHLRNSLCSKLALLSCLFVFIEKCSILMCILCHSTVNYVGR